MQKDSKQIVIGVVVAVALAVIVYLMISGGDDSTPASTTAKPAAPVETAVPARIVGQTELSQEASNSDTPVFWAGPESGIEYEYTALSSGNVYVRYVDKGTKAGDPSSAFLTVGTYPVGNGVAAIKDAADGANVDVKHGDGGAVVMVNPQVPTSVYMAYPGSHYQIEVYDPDPATALDLATSGAITQVP